LWLSGPIATRPRRERRPNGGRITDSDAFRFAPVQGAIQIALTWRNRHLRPPLSIALAKRFATCCEP
jgi:hypothetical protein